VANIAPPAELSAPRGTLRFYSSLPGETFFSTGERVFGYPIREMTKMFIVNPYEE
jgi:hypothetical protein